MSPPGGGWLKPNVPRCRGTAPTRKGAKRLLQWKKTERIVVLIPELDDAMDRKMLHEQHIYWRTNCSECLWEAWNKPTNAKVGNAVYPAKYCWNGSQATWIRFNREVMSGVDESSASAYPTTKINHIKNLPLSAQFLLSPDYEGAWIPFVRVIVGWNNENLMNFNTRMQQGDTFQSHFKHVSSE